MHGGHPFWLAISIEILAVVAVLYFLAKVVKDGLGKGFKWAAYILLFFGFASIAGTICMGVMHMRHMRQCNMGQCPMMEEQCSPMMHGGWGHGHMGSHMRDGECNMHDSTKSPKDTLKKK